MTTSEASRKSGLTAMSVAAMGVVFGDIGTSPLYTMREVFNGHHPVPVTPDNVLGILSLVFWAMTITVSLKYVMFITRADNKGEGGIMALTALAMRIEKLNPNLLWLLSALGIFGAALFYGDAVITPAMSVLSAVEGLEVATPAFKPYIVPIAIGILVGLFLFQRSGTASMAALFGPVMLFWFATIGALGLWGVLKHPGVLAAIQNPFFMLVPEALLYPMVGLATAAAVIASQAVISGAFSLTSQAIQLGYCPRILIKFTSDREKGQIYIPNINWLLLIAVVTLVLLFRSSSNLAAAYGIAVTLTMMIDTLLAFVVVRALWKWNWLQAGLFLALFVAVDFAFFAASFIKVPDGGWFPLVLGAIIFTLFATWKRGRALLYEKLKKDSMPLDAFIKSLEYGSPHRVEGLGVFMTPNPDGVPRAMLHNLLHNKVLHNQVALLNVRVEDVPHVPEIDRVEVHALPQGFFQVVVRYGFMDEPDIPLALALCEPFGLKYAAMETSFFLGRETIVPRSRVARMPRWRQRLFTFMFRNAAPATTYFKIPTNRVVELGTQVEL